MLCYTHNELYINNIKNSTYNRKNILRRNYGTN